MRNSTLFATLAIALIAGTLAFTVNQTEKLRLLASNDIKSPAAVTAPVQVAQTAPTQNATTEVVANDTNAIQTADATTPVSSNTTGDLAMAAALNAQEPAAGTPAQAEATTDTSAADVTAPAADNSAEAEAAKMAPAPTPAPEPKFKVDVKAALEDRSVGSLTAPVTIEDYSSLSCPHCAAFHADVFPQVKKNYIDTGKVRWIYRSFPLNDQALRAEMVARCAPKDQYDKLLDLIYGNQQRWAFTDDPLPNLNMLLRIAGISDDMFLACTSNKVLEAGMAKKIQDATDKYQINSTPTFVMNEGAKKFSGGGSYTGFAFDLDELLKKIDDAKAAPQSTPSTKK